MFRFAPEVEAETENSRTYAISKMILDVVVLEGDMSSQPISAFSCLMDRPRGDFWLKGTNMLYIGIGKGAKRKSPMLSTPWRRFSSGATEKNGGGFANGPHQLPGQKPVTELHHEW